MPQDLAAEALSGLVAHLIKFAVSLSPYQLPATPPHVAIVPQERIQEMVCEQTCRVRAIYVSGRGIFISEDLRIYRNKFDRSVLFHEIVHHLQDVQGFFGREPSCYRWASREAQAYKIQWKYLMYLKSSQTFHPPSVRMISKACKSLKQNQ